MTTNKRRGPGRPSGNIHVVDRETLLDAAERVLARDGSGASLEAIAEEAGVTKPIVYLRVGSRAELSNALANRLAERLVVAAGPSVSSSRLDRDTLAAFCTTTLRTIGEHRELFLYVTRGNADDTAERALYLAATSAQPLAVLLGRWREHQGLDPAVALPWAYGVIGMLNMVALWWLEEGHGPVEVVAGQLADLMWTGLRGTPTPN